MGTTLGDRRTLAGVTDLIFLYGVQMATLFCALAGFHGANKAAPSTPLVLLVLAELLITIAYGASEVVRGATPGKLLLGLGVRSMSGEPAPVARLLVRCLLKFIPLTIMFSGTTALALLAIRGAGMRYVVSLATLSGAFMWLALIDTAFMLGSRKLPLHDRIAGTRVIDTRTAPAAEPR